MSFQVKIKEVNVEVVKKGKSNYSVAQVTYDFKGETRTQKIMSFSNPDVFQKVQELKEGDLVEVTITKNDAGYNQWAKIEMAGEAKTPAVGSSSQVTKSSYETAQERADNRVRIVRQSSLSNAIATLGGTSTGTTVDEIISLAQRYFDWVYETGSTDET